MLQDKSDDSNIAVISIKLWFCEENLIPEKWLIVCKKALGCDAWNSSDLVPEMLYGHQQIDFH